MPKNQMYYTDGVKMSAIDLPQYPVSAWNWLSGKPEDDKADMYSRVAAVYRVANLSADAVGSMPFTIYGKGGSEVDGSDDYKNIAGVLRKPREIFRLWRLSLFVTGTAYGLIGGKDIRYLSPDTMTPIFDKDEGLVGFKRSVGNQQYKYQVYENPIDNAIFWMFRQDHTTEVEASKNTEMNALLNAAGVIYYSDEHIRKFFERGGIKPTMLMVKGVPTKEEREAVENIWTKVISGTYKWLGKVFNADAIEPHVIGEGIDNLKDSALHKEKIEDIAMAAGMPLSLLLANSANFATANVEYATWFNNSVIPWCMFIEDCVNELLFEPRGYHLSFTPEITNMGTAEEQERAGAYAALVASNVLPSVAAQMLGYEIPADMEDYTILDEQYFMMLDRKASASAINMPEIRPPSPPNPTVQPDLAKPKSQEVSLTLDQLRELDLWQQIASRKMKRGDDMHFPFVAKKLNETMASLIRGGLRECKTQDDIDAVFELSATEVEDVKRGEMLTLASSLNRAVDLVLSGEKPDETT